ncbi:glycosyltransferase family 4 protein, partial [Thiohalocapsa marina]|uniref:glycosyltransferase family 4 protein n=1 Tax=Thiohalocapsa marina TaxID=424902 RepID=UPI0036DD22C7
PLGFFSVERLFEDIRSALPEDIRVDVHLNRHLSQGLWGRLVDVLRAAWHQGEVNHVTGDVHYLTYLLKRKRTVLTIHDCVSLERLSGFKRWIFWFFWYWLPEKRCAAITVISESTKQELLRHLRCDPGKITVIHNPVSDEFTASPKPFDSQCPRILQVRTTENKNIPRVAEALHGLSCRLVIIGPLSDAQRGVLERFCIDYENHVGLSREEVVDQYRQADLLMFASLYEGFGLPIVEANAIGRPVITSRLYSMPEVGGDAACYVDPYAVPEIRATVERMIQDETYRQELIRNGFENAARFQKTAIAAQYASLYRKIAGSADAQP